MKNLHQINKQSIPPEFRAWASVVPLAKYYWDGEWLYSSKTIIEPNRVHINVLYHPETYFNMHTNLRDRILYYRQHPTEYPPNLNIL